MMVKKVGKVSMDYTYYPGEDLYCDGEVENEILDIVTNNSEEDYNRIINERKKWPILYHLSHVRENIIEWLPLTKNDKVLEIGAGCGAVTGALARKAAEVTCIELSEKRSLINANRHRDCDNIKILLGNFETIEPTLEEKYDYITLIGVLEYAGLYISDEKPFVRFLQVISRHLKDDGKIIVAIENRMGLKYLAGCQEDHVGLYFEGIEGYTQTSSAKTFSKTELIHIVEDAGFKEYEFYYPYPDYKFPSVLYSDEWLPKVGELQNNSCSLDTERLLLFNETLAYNELIKSGDFPYFSNSFLVELKKGQMG